MGCLGFGWLWINFCRGAWWSSILSLLSPSPGKIWICSKRVGKARARVCPQNYTGEWAAGLWTFYVINSHAYYDNLDFTGNTLHWLGPLPLLLPLFSLFCHTWKPFRCWCRVKRVLKWLCNGFYRTELQNRKALWKPSLRSDASLPKVVT